MTEDSCKVGENSLNSNSDLAELLTLQDNFISLVHSAVYHAPNESQDPEVLAQAAIRFEVHHISPANQQFGSMLKDLSRDLIDRKIPYDLSLRDCFQRLLQTDFLPLLRINRYELTKLSLFGFDIYVEPLEAFLQILSRLEASKKRLIESPLQPGADSAEGALLQGWDQYLQYCEEWRISFNIYILDEYLRFGGKSFLKKDREILFTGISNLYSGLVAALAERKRFKLLKELASINNSLYNFHPSFDYFQFFTYLLPLHDDYEPIFALADQILQKCLRTNILTPLLFGVLRHREAFISFVQGVDSLIWLPYLNAIAAGITINLKFRILQYEEIIELFALVVNKAGLLGLIRTEEITGKLEEGWRDAKQFFISAVKIGFNSGEVQTWKTVEFESIGSRILSSVLDGMLLSPELNPSWELYLQNGEQKLSHEIRELSCGKLDVQSVKSWICQLDTPVDSESKLLHLIRSANLFYLLAIEDEYSLSFIVGCILRIEISPKRATLLRIEEYLQKINAVLCRPREGGWNLIKDRVIELHRKYPPKKDIDLIIRFYFSNYEPKRAFLALLDIIDLADPATCSALAVEVGSKFVPSADASSKLVEMKTFEKELLVRGQLVNAPYEGHCILSVLSSKIIEKEKGMQTLTKKIVEANPSIAFTMLNFPINQKGRLFSLGTYLIDNSQYHSLLQDILGMSRGEILSEEGVDLVQTLTFPSICHHLCKKINQVQEIQQLEPYSRLLLWSLLQVDQGEAYWRQLLSIYFYILEKSNQKEGLNGLVQDICILLGNVFGDKLDSWLAIQLISKIEGKFVSHKAVRKRAFKVSGSSIYFINQLPKEKEGATKVQAEKNVDKKEKKNARQHWLNNFWNSFVNISGLGLDKLIEMRDSQNIVFQEQSKALFVPQLSAAILEALGTEDGKTVNFVGINGQNYIKLVEHAIQRKDAEYLSANRYVSSLNPKLALLLAFQQQSQQNILRRMCEGVSEGEREKIAGQIFLESQSLPHYVNYMEGIEFMALRNNFNWRALIDHISKQLANSHLASHLLQYSQYISITGEANSDYQKLIKEQALLFKHYVVLLRMKLGMDEGLEEEERDLKLTNQLTFMSHLLNSLQMYQFASKLGTLHRNMLAKGIQEESQWASILKDLSQVVGKHVKSDKKNEVSGMLEIYQKELQAKGEGEGERQGAE